MGVGFFVSLWGGCTCLLLIISSSQCLYLNSSEEDGSRSESIATTKRTMKNIFGIFYSEKEILQIFMDDKNNRNVSDLLRVYEEQCCTLRPQNVIPKKPRRPFIVIEANHRPPRKLVAKQLAEILGGQYISVPPPCLKDFLYTFDYNARLRRAFFGLAVYATAYEVRAKYHHMPVVSSGYWADQTAFAVAKEFEEDDIPDIGDSIYNWPEDLLKPDVSFLMDVPHKNEDPYATTAFPDEFAHRRLVAFRRMRKPRLREMRNALYYDTFLAMVQSKMLTVFQHPRWKRKNVRY